MARFRKRVSTTCPDFEPWQLWDVTSALRIDLHLILFPNLRMQWIFSTWSSTFKPALVRIEFLNVLHFQVTGAYMVEAAEYELTLLYRSLAGTALARKATGLLWSNVFVLYFAKWLLLSVVGPEIDVEQLVENALNSWKKDASSRSNVCLVKSLRHATFKNRWVSLLSAASREGYRTWLRIQIRWCDRQWR